MRVRLATAVLAAGVLAATAGAAGPIGGTLSGDRISISANGVAVVYQGRDAEGYGAFLADTASGAATRLTYRVVNGERRGADGSRPSISADGRMILVASRGLGTEAEQRPEQLWLVDPGGSATRVASGLPENPRELSLAAGGGAAVFNTSLAEPYHVRFGAAPRQIAQRGTYLSISGDGGKVAYWWDFKVYVWEAATGKAAVVNRDAAGVELAAATVPQISAGGRYVSLAGYVNGKQSHVQAWRKDLVTGTLLQVSRDTKGRDAAQNVTWTAISADGSRVLFLTAAKLTPEDHDTTPDAYVKDIPSGDLIFVETGGAPTHIVLSGDGSTVAWNSGGRLFVEKLGGGTACEASALAVSAPTAECLTVEGTDVTFEVRLERARVAYGRQLSSLDSERAAIMKNLEADRESLKRAYTTYTEAAGATKQLAAAMAAVQAAIRATPGDDRARAAVAGHVTALQAAMRHYDLVERRARMEYAAAETAWNDRHERLRLLERRMLTVGENLAPLDFELQGVDVSSGGREPPYRVDFQSNFAALEDVTRDLDSLGKSIKRLRDEKERTFRDFVEARQETIRLLERLGGLTGKVMQVAVGKAGVTLAINLGDFAKAWFLEGGPVGVFKEAAKKWAEFGMSVVVDTAGLPAEKDEEAQVVSGWMREALADTFERGSVKQTLFERGYKEAVINPLVEPVADDVGKQLLKELSERTRGSFEAATLWRKSKETLERQVTKAKLRGELIEARRGILRREFGGVKGKFGSIGTELVKDFGEKALHNLLDEHERALWAEAASADRAARLWFTLYQAAAKAYYEATDREEQLLELKRRLLLEWNPNKGQHVRVNEPFARPDELRIYLRGEWPREARRLPIQVVVNGKVARPTAQYLEFRLPTKELEGETKLRIEIR